MFFKYVCGLLDDPQNQLRTEVSLAQANKLKNTLEDIYKKLVPDAKHVEPAKVTSIEPQLFALTGKDL